mgnify:CR=1 FL=1
MVYDMNKKILVILIGLIMISSFYGVLAESKPHWKADTYMIYTDEMVVQFHDRTPTYRIWIPDKNETAVYIVKFNRIIEFIDSNNDGRYNGSVDSILAQAPLTAHDVWEVTADEFNTSDGAYELRITFNGSVRVYKMGASQPIGTGKVAFVNHIYDRDVETNGYTIEGGREVKIDIVFSYWPWSSEDSKLALEIVFAGMFRGHSGVPKCHREQVQYENVQMHRIQMEGDADYQAEFRYTEQARIQTQNGEEECKVNATDEFKQSSAVTWLVYPHFNGTLIHDPSIYVGEPTGNIVDIIGSNRYVVMGLVLAAVVVVVVVIKAKK